MRQPEDQATLELELELPKRRRRSSRGDYYPDTISPKARRAIQAGRDWRFWHDLAEAFPTRFNRDHEEMAGEIARWRALEVIEPGCDPR